ncbi:MAG: ADP-ribosylglycohydrolase family protein [Thiotrichales bacterium]|jgi:ADP-ribosyl-[dinitrogen reductase] hydrolase|nr:ADP-ribosylglycohydrolase family protein [Thiotrichales bacterium]
MDRGIFLNIMLVSIGFSVFFRLHNGRVMPNYSYWADNTGLCSVSEFTVNEQLQYLKRINRGSLSFDRLQIDDVLSVNGFALLVIKSLNNESLLDSQINQLLEHPLLPKVLAGQKLMTNIVNSKINDVKQLISVHNQLKLKLFEHQSVFPQPQLALAYDEDDRSTKLIQLATGLFCDAQHLHRDQLSSRGLWAYLVGRQINRVFAQIGIDSDDHCDVNLVQDRKGYIQRVEIMRCVNQLDDKKIAAIEQSIVALSPLPTMSEVDYLSEIMLIGKAEKLSKQNLVPAIKQYSIEVSADVYQSLIELKGADETHTAVIDRLVKNYYETTRYRWQQLYENLRSSVSVGEDAATDQINEVKRPFNNIYAIDSNKSNAVLLGLACGDALGTTLEFSKRDSQPKITQLQGGGPFNLPVGAWTDDTSMALCLAKSLIDCWGFDVNHQLSYYLRWYHQGFCSSTGRCFDIGHTTEKALLHFEETGEMMKCYGEFNAGNGSLMRLAPIVMFYSQDYDAALYFAGESSKTTHAHPACVESCWILASILWDAMQGISDKETLLSAYRGDVITTLELLPIVDMGYRHKSRDQIKSTGYVVDSLEAALWSFWITDSFEDAIVMAANLAGDSDTIAAICGQVAGAYYGEQAIPREWKDKLYQRDEIALIAQELTLLK